MIKGEPYDCIKSDVWSSGIVLYAMVCGYLPFENQNTTVLEDSIVKAQFEIPSFVSDNCKDLLTCILNPDPSERFTIDEIYKHGWIQSMQAQSQAGNSSGQSDLIDDTLLEEICTTFSLNKAETRSDIENNKHNKHTSCYFILKKRHEREKFMSQVSIK